MKYIANPVEVDAFKITGTGPLTGDGLQLQLENGESVWATAQMVVRFQPGIGDYWVVQSDGYIYVNPRDVFLRKYSPASFGGS